MIIILVMCIVRMKTTTTLFYVAAAMTIVGIIVAFADLARHKVTRPMQQPVVITVVPTMAATDTSVTSVTSG